MSIRGNERVQWQGKGRTAWFALGAGALLAGAVASAYADTGTVEAGQSEVKAGDDNDARLQKVVVKGRQVTPKQVAKIKLQQVAGTVSVVDNKEVEKGRSANAEDVLAFQPGVYAVATSGNSANKVSIRGSGLNTFYQGYSLGLKYLYDGLPITGPGGTQEDLLISDGVDYTEVLNGANAFQYSALSLGGAINYATHTGRTSPGYYARFEAGNYGYRKAQLSAGGVSGDTDYYVSAVQNERDGFQQDTPNWGKTFIGNIGHKINDKLETRLIARYREEKLVNGSTLSKDQIRTDPTVNRTPYSARRKDGTSLLVSKTTYTFDDDAKLEIGLGYNDYPLHNGWRYSATPQDWVSKDTSATLRYLRVGDKLFGKSSDTTLSFSHTRLRGYVNGWTRQPNGTLTDRQFTRYTGSHDTVLSGTNDLQLNDKTWLTTGLAAANINRNVQIERTVLPNNATTNPLGFGNVVSYSDWYALPRLGLRYQLSPQAQIFGNVSRSVDAPVTWQIGSTGSPFARPLEPQKATTVELGVRGGNDALEGSLTIYRAWLKDELLTIRIDPNPNVLPVNANASETIHQGVEAAVQARLWQNDDGDKVTLRQAYTLNDFFYRNDPDFGGNELPVIPRNTYQAELQYSNANGFYAGVNVRTASSYYADFANTLSADPYVLLGAKIGYEVPSKRWAVFLDLRNLTDEKYAAASNTTFDASTSPINPATGNSTSPNFYPGDGFSGVAGVSFRF